MNIFAIIIILTSLFYQHSFAPTPERTFGFDGGFLQIFLDLAGPPKWYYIEVEHFTHLIGSIVCRDLYDSAFYYYYTQGEETTEMDGRVDIICDPNSVSIQDCQINPIDKNELGHSVRSICHNPQLDTKPPIMQLSDNSVYLLQEIRPESSENLLIWGKVCFNNDHTRSIACTNLQNEDVTAAGIIPVNDYEQITFINFMCGQNVLKLEDCSFNISDESDCENNEESPLVCDDLTISTTQPIIITQATLPLFPNVVITTVTSPVISNNTETSSVISTNTETPNPVATSNTTSVATTLSSNTSTTLQSLPISTTILAAIVTTLSVCVILTIIVFVMVFFALVITIRLRGSKVRQQNDYQSGTNLDYEVIEPEVQQDYSNTETVHRSISITPQTRYQQIIPQEVITELEAIYSVRSLEPPDDGIYDEILHTNDMVVLTVEDREYINITNKAKQAPSDNVYLPFSCELPCFIGQSDTQVWEPEETLKGIYAQMALSRYREINSNELTRKELLGEGNFGNVHSGVWKSHNGEVPVAIKSLKVEDKSSGVSFLQEAAILGQFNHPNILKLLGVVTLTTPLMMVTELMRTGLKEFLYMIDNSDTFPMNQLGEVFLRFTLEIASGMEHLVYKQHVHRDLAARNILVSHNLTCKIGDFGLARRARVNDEYYLSQGGLIPVKWTAPEAMIFKKYSEKSDVFSFGVTLYEIWSVGEVPWAGMDNEIVIQKVCRGEVMAPPGGCPRNIYKLMVDCWHPAKDYRPTFKDIIGRLKNRNQMSPKGKNNSRFGEANRTNKVYSDLQEVYTKSKQVYFDI